MRRFLTSRLFRACVCLILVCCVLVLNSPIRVQAVLATSTAILIGAAAVLILGTMGIVLIPKTELEYESIGIDLSNWMYAAANQPDSQITEIQVGIWLEDVGAAMGGGKNPDPLKPSVWDVFITTQFLLWAKDFLGDRAVSVPAQDSYGNNASYCGQVVYAGEKLYHPRIGEPSWYVPDSDVTFYGYKVSTGVDASRVGYYTGMVFVSATAFNVTDKGGTKYKSTYNDELGVYYVHRWSGYSYDAGSDKLSQYLSNLVGYRDYTEQHASSPSITETLSWLLGLGPVEPPVGSYMTPEYIEQAIQENISAIEALKAWQAGDPVEIPDLEYGNILTETQTLTQSVTQIQTQLAQGNMTLQQYLDTLTNGSGVNFNGGGTGSGGNDPSTPTPPSSDIAPFMLDLKDFFPFCIPFDLYKFFSLLCAEPEAPVFTWVVQDLSGNSYPISVDLSKWDNFAALFRKLQLFVFIIGLAMSSRKFIKW